MNRQKINTLTKTSNIQYRKIDNRKRNFQFFNGYTSELYNFNIRIFPKADRYDIHLTDIKMYQAGDMIIDRRPIKSFRSYQLASLKLIGFVACKSEKAAKRYANLGGHVVRLVNGYSEMWGVIK